MRNLKLRLELAWLTVIAVVVAALMAALRPEGDVAAATLAHGVEAFGNALGSRPSIEVLNLFRALLAADMLFLLAYGLLLRTSISHLHPIARRRWFSMPSRADLARHVTVVLMAADAVENISALAILRQLTDVKGGTVAGWLFWAMNAGALVKWASAALVLLFLGLGWMRTPARGTLWRRIVAAVIALSFLAGAAGAALLTVSDFYPAARSIAGPVALLAPALALLLQFRLLDLTGVLARFVYLARVPLLVLLVMASFGPVALGPLTGLLGGIIDVVSAWGIGVVTAAGLVVAAACGTQIDLVRAYGSQRMLDASLRVLRQPVLADALRWTALAAVGSLLFCIGLASLRLGGWQIAFGVAGGAIAGGAFVVLQELVAAWVSEPPAGRPARLPLASRHAPLLGGWIRSIEASGLPAPFDWLKNGIQRLSIAGRLFGLGSGYIGLDANGRRQLLPGHSFATAQLVVSALFYVVLLRTKFPGSDASPEAMLWVPTAGSIVLLLLLASWTLSGIAFFLDRYRWPLFTAFLAIVVLTGSRVWTDHVIATGPAKPSYVLSTPGRVLGAFPRPLVVAAAGGGIQAGAWTARALEGIDQELAGTLHRRVALVSGVSGGSMGALYYGAYEGASLRDATCRSMAPSLDDIASALIGGDALRIVGWPSSIDRGTALEDSWALRLPPAGDFSLRAWAERVGRVADRDAATRPFPAFLFNTTIVETGQPMAFATTQFPTATYRATFDRALEQYPVVESANTVFGLAQDDRAQDVQIQAVTAARLSAAFPYVSPAATLQIGNQPRYHLVDGGYYDNYGLAAVSQWLDDALEEMAEPPPEIGVLVLRGLVGSGSAIERDLRESERDQKLQVKSADVPYHGWAWQLAAPPSTFLKTREFGQWAGGNQALKLLIEKWRLRKVTITPQLFDFPAEQLPPACRLAPLSWKLSLTQQICIDQGWTLRARQVFATDAWGKVRGMAAPVSGSAPSASTGTPRPCEPQP